MWSASPCRSRLGLSQIRAGRTARRGPWSHGRWPPPWRGSSPAPVIREGAERTLGRWSPSGHPCRCRSGGGGLLGGLVDAVQVFDVANDLVLDELRPRL